MLLSKNTKICVIPNTNAKILVTPKANLQCKQLEYRSSWVPNANSHVGHVDFMSFVLISLALGNQHEHSLLWNMGFMHYHVDFPHNYPYYAENKLGYISRSLHAAHQSGVINLKVKHS